MSQYWNTNNFLLVGWQISMWWIYRKINYEPISTSDRVGLDVFLRELLPESSKGVWYKIANLEIGGNFFGFIEVKDMFNIFDTSVSPILCYGSHIWSYQYFEKIEKVQIHLCKKICYLLYNTCHFLALGFGKMWKITSMYTIHV